MKIYKKILPAAIVLSVIWGCGNKPQIPLDKEGSESEILNEENDAFAEYEYSEAENIAAVYRDIYEEAVWANTLGSLKTVEEIVDRLGRMGYVAAHSENQVDMAGAEQVEAFCEAVDDQLEAEVTILVVTAMGGFRKLDLKTGAGKVDVVREDYQYDEEGYFVNKGTVRYPADFWEYTEDGYLLFEGNYFSEGDYILTLSPTPEHTALRVEPLDRKCRELNRQYIMPVGYQKNNLFLTDWSQEEFGNLDFYDLFDRLYPLCYGQTVPYIMSDDLRVGAVYRIPREEFEGVIRSYLSVDRETLQAKTAYFSEDDTYEYKPRGFEETEYPNIPYPEVVSCEENRDGTVTLTVNAVFPNDNTSRAFSHEVVVRPGEQGGFAYVSNRMLTTEADRDLWWHSDRLTAEQWTEIYGADCLFDQEERQTLERYALEAAELVKEAYRDVETEAAGTDDGNSRRLTGEERRTVAAMLGEAGYVSVTEDSNMENYEKMEDFYTAYKEGRDAMVTLCNVNLDGSLGVTTFAYREGKAQTCLVEIGWREGGLPEVRNSFVHDIEEICLTEKGYFIYSYENVAAHASLRQYWRIRPLSDRCRELTEKYVFGLSYMSYDVLTANWDESNVEDILAPCMFGDIYHIATGQTLQLEKGRIPAEVLEGVMTTCFPVSREELREKCGYDEASDSYPYEDNFPGFSTPAGEVVAYVENGDGTITLSVDGVWIENEDDCAFQSTLVIQPFGDGTFRYLSNTVK